MHKSHITPRRRQAPSTVDGIERDLASMQITSPVNSAVSHETITPDSGRMVLFSSPRILVDLAPVKEFLIYVGNGEQTRAEQMLKSNPDLALMTGELKDCAEREFNGITGFQYALWALDYHMWTMIGKYLSKEHARDQIIALNQGSWIDSHGTQITWQPLIIALDIYIKNYSQWCSDKKYGEMCAHWRKQVGGAQLLLPAHVINEYSRSDRRHGFNPCPIYNGQRADSFLPREGVAEWKTGGYGGKLGETFAWGRGRMPRTLGGRQPWPPERYQIEEGKPPRLWAPYDLAACEELLRSRKEQAQALVSELLQTLPARHRPRVTV